MQQFYKTSQDIQALLKELNIEYKLYDHHSANTIQDMQSIKLDKAPLIKNLFYKDKKSNYYLVSAIHDSVVGQKKQFFKSIGTSGGNVTFAKEEALTEVLQSQKGHLNAFALVNDTEKKVKNFIVDEKLMQHDYWAFHPMENNQTIELKREDFIKKFIEERLKRTVVALNLEDKDETAQQEQKQQLQQQNTEEVKQSESHETNLKMSVKKSENLSDWYSQVITKSEMLDYYEISGCYILRPWAYFIWESVQIYFDKLIKEIDVQNAYFPMFVSERALNKEKSHIEGFSPEVAWVTKSGSTDLHEPIAIRPTSETIMYPSYAKWIKSHRDLPLKLNQWTNIVRWEFKHPTPFIRTREFLWQEGHTAHATEKEATQETFAILDFYEKVYREVLAIPVIKGIKSENEKFPGAYFTSTVETMIPENGRAIQAATSHQLGQNFSKMFEIQFEDEKKQKQFVWQTSWGLTTRSLGIMTLFHGDDQGLILPPFAAQFQVVIIVIFFKETSNLNQLYDKAVELQKVLKKSGIRAHCDLRDNYNPGWKYNHWELKGVPIRIELGPKDFDKQEVRAVRRFDGAKLQIAWDNIAESLNQQLQDIHNKMYEKASSRLKEKQKVANNWGEFMQLLNQKNMVFTRWCKNNDCEELVKEKSKNESKLEQHDQQLAGAAKTLCMPLEQPSLQPEDVCFHCGKKAQTWVYWGRSY